MNFHGLAIGAIMILAIGFGHILVIKWEYCWGAKSWPGMLAIGLGLLIASLLIGNMLLSGAPSFSNRRSGWKKDCSRIIRAGRLEFHERNTFKSC
jgi:hypothetical protein